MKRSAFLASCPIATKIVKAERCYLQRYILLLSKSKTADTLVYGIAFNKVVLDDLTSPNAESSTTFAMNTVANRDNDIEVIYFGNDIAVDL